jgi:hypothetical protein
LGAEFCPRPGVPSDDRHPEPLAAENANRTRNFRLRGRRLVMNRIYERAEQKGLAGTPAHGSGIVGSVGSGAMVILVCFG